MITRDELIKVGNYNHAHGLHGEISATFIVNVDLLEAFSCLISEVEGIFVPFFVDSSRPKSNKTALLKLHDFESNAEVSLLTGRAIHVLRTEYAEHVQQPEKVDGALDAFIGYHVADEQGREIGEIIDYDDSTANVLFRLENETGDTFLIPAASDLVEAVDHEKKLLVMNLPSGITEL